MYTVMREIETADGTIIRDSRTATTADQVDRIRQALRADAPTGSTQTITVR